MLPLSYLCAHFLGDFLWQSDQMALNKSKHWGWLAYHCLVYTSIVWLAVAAPFLYLYFMVGGWQLRLALYQVLLTFPAIYITHFLTDAITSRITSRLWFFERAEKYRDLEGVLGYPLWRYVDGRRHWFFVVIGLDQLIHYWTLYYIVSF